MRRRGQRTLSVANLLEAAEAAKKASAMLAPEKQEEWKPNKNIAAPAAQMKKAEAVYSPEPIFFIKGVSVKIPTLTSHFYPKSHEFQTPDGRTVKVENHYAVLCGISGCSRSLVQRNYFGFRESDIDEHRVVTIKAWDKISKKGNKILLLDITKTWGAVAKFAMRFVEKEPWDIPAPHGGGIRFLPIEER